MYNINPDMPITDFIGNTLYQVRFSLTEAMLVFGDDSYIKCFVDVKTDKEGKIVKCGFEDLILLLDRDVVGAEILNPTSFSLSFNSHCNIIFEDDRSANFESFNIRINGKDYIV